MKLNRFVEDRQGRWERLGELVTAAGKRPERLEFAEIKELAAGYRAVAADLAIARRSFPADPVVGRLERLAVGARALVYERHSRRKSLVAFFADGFWQLLWQRRRALALAASLLFIPGLLGALWALADPPVVRSLMPVEFLWVTEEQSTDQGRDALGLAGFSFFVMVNNIRVTLVAFALGVTLGLGTGYVLLQNGLILGGITGLALEAGNGDVIVAAIAAHGVIELTAIVVGGAAGLSLGNALLRPGRRTRREAMRSEAANAFRIAAGIAPWLILAAFIEGFVSRVGLGPLPTSLVGVSVGAIFWALLQRRGTLGS